MTPPREGKRMKYKPGQVVWAKVKIAHVNLSGSVGLCAVRDHHLIAGEVLHGVETNMVRPMRRAKRKKRSLSAPGSGRRGNLDSR